MSTLSLPLFLILNMFCFEIFWSVCAEIIIHKSRGEVSLVEQDTIEFVSLAIKKISLSFMI